MSTIITDALSQKEIILLTSGLKKGFEAVDDLVLKYPFVTYSHHLH